jgi:multicomponent Na+:H+ antiporter subunit F
MNVALPVLALLVSLILGLVRVVLGPSDTDRMLASQLIGTTGVAMLLLLSRAARTPALLDVALVFALLAAVTAIAFVARQQGAPRGEP